MLFFKIITHDNSIVFPAILLHFAHKVCQNAQVAKKFRDENKKFN